MDDVIFLLSKDEYEEYRECIPQLNLIWWLRSPDDCHQFLVVIVFDDGSLYHSRVNRANICVRPALRTDKVKINESENNFVYCGITWVKISKNIAISELPIGRYNFNKNFLDNDYKNSDIRKWLLEWHEKRKNY